MRASYYQLVWSSWKVVGLTLFISFVSWMAYAIATDTIKEKPETKTEQGNQNKSISNINSQTKKTANTITNGEISNNQQVIVNQPIKSESNSNSAVISASTPIPTQTQTVEDEAKIFVKNWFDGKFSPAVGNRRCAAVNSEYGGELHYVLVLEGISEPTISGNPSSPATERNAGVTWSGTATFKASLSKIFLYRNDAANQVVDKAWVESNWQNDTSFSVKVLKERGKLKVNTDNTYFSNVYLENFNNIEVDRFYRFSCQKAFLLKNSN
jgi:hypothetical protein